jgi:uncharacterized protein involved in exopolysaccharide biosynthesis
MVTNLSRQVNQRELLRVVFRHWRKATIFFFSLMALIGAYSLLTPRHYRSEGKLFVRLGRENVVLDPTATVGRDGSSVVTLPNSRESEVNSVVEILCSRVLLEAVVREMGASEILAAGTSTLGSLLGRGQAVSSPQPSPEADEKGPTATPSATLQLDRDFQKAVSVLSDRLEIQPVRKSNVISITYRGQHPELAQTVVATLIDKHLDEHVRLNRAGGTRTFLTQQASDAREKLVTAERELKDLKAATGLVAPEQQQDELVARTGRLREELAQTLGDMAASEEKTQKLQEALRVLPATEVTSTRVGLDNHGTDLMRQRYYGLQLRELELRSRYTESHPSVIEIRKQVEQAQRLLGREEPTRTEVVTETGPAYAMVRLDLTAEEARLAALRGRAQQLEKSLAQCRRDLDRHNENRAELARLQREVQIQEANYLNYATSLEQARIDEALEMRRISNINVAQPASFEPEPVRPRLALTLLLACFCSVCGALGITLLAESLDRTLKSPEDVDQALSVPVLVSVPRFDRANLGMNGRN